MNAIAPGWIRTAMLEEALRNDEDRRQQILQRTPVGRLGEPADIGKAAIFLAAPASEFITGAVFPIDGGASIGF